jgi:hypothetical protein
MLFRGRVLLFLAIIFTTSSANAGPNEQAFCEAYASAAVTTVNKALTTGCKTQDNGRWDPLFDDHLNVCLNVWVRDPVNGGLVAINETLFRALDLSTCLFSQAHVTPTWGSGAFPGDDAPTLDTFCRAYAAIAEQQLGDTAACGFDFTQGRFDANFDHHRLACMGWTNNSAQIAGATAANETTGRTQDKVACAVRLANTTTPPPPPATVTVLLPSDVYTNFDPNTGKASNKQPNPLTQQTPGPVTLVTNDAPWFQLQWPGGGGWVYSAADYLALQLP